VRVRDALARGIESGLVPQQKADDDGEVVTAPPSWWFSLVCKTCGHTFRRGDRVRVDRELRTVVHLEPGLGCALGPAASQPSDALLFVDGLLAAWPCETKVITLTHSDWRLPRPDLDRAGQCCLYCAQTLRPGEQVIVCPCSRNEPACGAAVHRHPGRGLSCWERWRPDGTLPVCPVAKAKVADRS
jgi:hypothetical protein